jgi:hypothetical protein
MKFKLKIYHRFDTRIKNGFLFFPKTITNECRWLEFAEWEELLDGYWADGVISWKATYWTDSDEYKHKELVNEANSKFYEKPKIYNLG